MARLRLQSQLLLSTLLIICALAGAILLIIRHTVRTQIADQVKYSTDASVQEFETVQRQLQVQLSRTAAIAGRNSHLESADDHAGRPDHPGWIHPLLEARGKRFIPPCGSGRPRGCPGRHAERAQSRGGGRFPANLPARRAGIRLVVLGGPALLGLSSPDPRGKRKQCQGSGPRGHRI